MASKPKKLGTLIDALYAAREERQAFDRDRKAQLAEMQAKEDDLKSEIIKQLQAQKLNASRGDVATAAITVASHAQVDLENGGWMSIWKWAVKNDAPDIYYKRLVTSAVTDRMEAGVTIPGVKIRREQDLSLTKAAK